MKFGYIWIWFSVHHFFALMICAWNGFWPIFSSYLVTLFLRFGHFIPTIWALYSYCLTLFLRFGQLKFSVGHFHYDHNPLNVPFYKKIKIKIMACFSTKLILREWIGNSLRRTREGTNCRKKKWSRWADGRAHNHLLCFKCLTFLLSCCREPSIDRIPLIVFLNIWQ